MPNLTRFSSDYNLTRSRVLDYEELLPIPELPVQLLVACTVLYVLVFFLGLVGNIAVILVVLQCRSMRTSINLLFMNLCLADLFALVITGPTAVVDMYAKEAWYLGPFMCKLVAFLENVVGNASALTILAISVERHRVAYASSTITTNMCSVLKSFLVIWLASLLGALPMLFITQFKQATYVDGTPVSRCETPIEKAWHKAYTVITTLLFFILPLFMILLLYTKVYMKLMILFRREQKMSLTYPREIVRLKRQMTQIIITVVFVFFICHTPFRTIALWSMFSPPHVFEQMHYVSYFTMIYMTRILWYSNHAINPFVYNFVSRKFRRALLWLCCERRRRRHRLEDWKDLFHNRQRIRMDSLRQQHHQSTAGRLYDIDNNNRDKTEQEAMDRQHSHFQRNDFLVLYEHLLLE